MSFNISGAQSIPLGVLGGLVTEMAPTACPEGVSPDNKEMMYLPGSAYSRSGFQKVFSNPFPTGGPNNFRPTVVYGKSLVTSSGDIKNLFFDSNGILWVEDWTNSPGTYTQLFAATPGSQCTSITAFGREYIAISDGLHGTWPPLQYDGTFLDRLTQDGPGVPPSIANVAYPAVALVSAGGSGTSATPSSADITSTADGGDPVPPPTIQIFDWVSGTASQIIVNLTTVMGVMGVDTATVETQLSIDAGVTWTSVDYQTTTTAPRNIVLPGPFNLANTEIRVIAQASSFTGNTTTAEAIINSVEATTGGGSLGTLVRQNNIVTGNTTAAHNLQVGYLAQISGLAATQAATISTIVINNEDNPGIALITTSAAHGLLPENFISITGVAPVAVGGAITAATRSGQIATITTTTAHGLTAGTAITIAGVTDTSFNGSWFVSQVVSDTVFTFVDVDVDATSSGGTVTLNWPLPDTSTPNYYEVVSCPSATTFEVAISYGDGTWTSGNVLFAWDGTFYVTAIPSPTTFEYQQYGPNLVTTQSAGTVTPSGQAAPGLHLCQVLFLDRQGGITAPSPPTTFIANGGQYLNVSNIPIGPSNIVARILAFTGAQPDVPGVLPPFFYLAGPAQLEGQIVSTGTQINDNTTTSALLDFSDNSLFGTAAEFGAISVAGNNLVNQIVLDGALAFGYYDSRLSTVGQRATVQELLNMGFEGGTVPFTPTQPTGWTGSGGTLVTGLTGLGNAYAFTANGSLSQSAYLDAYGDPIIDGNITYAARYLVNGNGVNGGASLKISISSASMSFSSIATLAIPSGTAYVQADFSLVTPEAIPLDALFTITVAGLTAGTVTVDEGSIFDSQNPYLDNQVSTSYSDNPAGFDGVSGNNGPTNDTRKIMGFSIIRSTPYGITQDPSGRVHEILVNPTSEPSGWTWKEIQANCGTLSAFGITHSQADNETASSGDDWSAWPTETGAGLFDGSQVHKVSQEIQPNWNPGTSKYPWMAANTAINLDAATLISALCDPVDRMLYFFLPLGNATGTTAIYPLSFRELNSASAIANSPPVHVSLGGKLIVTDNTRKWTIWPRSMNGAARMYRTSTGTLTTVFFGGNGQSAGAAAGFGNVYMLNPDLLTDDDFGQLSPYYVTFYGPDAEKKQALQLTALRLLLAYVTPFISGTGQVTYSVLCDAPDNPWPLTVTRALAANPKFPHEFAGCQALGSRMALKIASSPVTGTDNSMNLQWLQFWYKNAKLTIRGAAQ